MLTISRTPSETKVETENNRLGKLFQVCRCKKKATSIRQMVKAQNKMPDIQKILAAEIEIRILYQELQSSA